MNEKQLLGRFVVQFIGEEGIDSGALTSALYREFFSQIFNEKYGLFEKVFKRKYNV